MALEPSPKRAIVFFDGQNLYHAARHAFGYATRKPSTPTRIAGSYAPAFWLEKTSSRSCRSPGKTTAASLLKGVPRIKDGHTRLVEITSVAGDDREVMLNRGRCYERSEEHTSELQSLRHLVCRLLLEKNTSHDEIVQTTHRAGPSDCEWRPQTSR